MNLTVDEFSKTSNAFSGSLEIDYKCDGCNKEFKGKDIILVVDKVKIGGNMFPNFITIDVNGEDRRMACPHCEKMHYDGFEQVR